MGNANGKEERESGTDDPSMRSDGIVLGNGDRTRRGGAVHPVDNTPPGKSAVPLTKEGLGSATWTRIHMIAAQFLPPQLLKRSPAVSSVPFFPPRTTNERNDSHLLQTNKALSDSASSVKGKSAVPLTKEDLGRATWTLLHMIAAQYPDHPSRQQKRDVKELMAIISRLYPCKECADHFKEILRANPVMVGSQEEFSQWLCHTHNIVNRSLGKPIFPCQRVAARWGKLDCKDRGCDLEGTVDSSTA